jgi:lysophospholipase L1-like esterase
MHTEIEPFDNGGGLVAFFERLYRSGRDSGAVHVVHYGDSHTASDDLTSALRESFQGRFGNGGPGFAMPGNPYRGYRRRDIPSYHNTVGWRTEGALFRKGDGRHGMGGVSLTARRSGEAVSLRANGESAELLFLQHPGGGSFDLWIDGQFRGSFSTDGPYGPATLDMTTIPGERHFVFKTTSAHPVRLLGTVVQNSAGVTWETAGINGARAGIITEWDDQLLAAQISRRDPGLIVLAYGTNESNGPGWDPQAYESVLRQVVSRVRAMAPAASILLVGPPDCRVRSQRALEDVIELQRKVAMELRCAFWDWRARMGGPGSIRKWVYAGMAQWDHIHFTSPGYQLVGRTIFEDMMRLFDRFVRARQEADDDKDR